MPCTEREKMIAGELYRSGDPELAALRLAARELVWQFNQSRPGELERRAELLRALFGRLGPRFEIEPPFQCDYGWNIRAGDELFINFGCVILDVCPVILGKQVYFGPGVHLYTATHPLDPVARTNGTEYGRPIAIGSRVWIGGGAVILPGVTIGDDTTIGAGSVVTRNIPAGVLAVGNPCRVVRSVPGALPPAAGMTC